MGHAVAPHRTVTLYCPRCPSHTLSSATLHRCGNCGGTWIDESALADRVAAMQSTAPRSLAFVTSASRERLPCAACRSPMEALLLFSIAVDRCKHHGIWFDKHELEHVLSRSSHARPRPATPAVDAGAALDVAAAGVEVAVEAASSGVIEILLEVLGGILSAIDV